MTPTEITPSEDTLPHLHIGSVSVVGEPSPVRDEPKALGAPPGPDAYAEDSFTAADSTPLNGRTMDVTDPGVTWDAGADWTIQGGAAETNSTSETRATMSDGEWDVRVEANITWGFAFGDDGTEWNGLTFRGDGPTWLAFRPVGWDGTRSYQIVDASGDVVASFPPSEEAAVSGASNLVQVDCTGTRIVCKVDERIVGSYDLTEAEEAVYGYSNPSATEFGIYSNEKAATPAGSFDDFKLSYVDSVEFGVSSYIRATEPGAVRFYSFRPPTLPDGGIVEVMSLLTRQRRSGHGLWHVRFGAIDSKGDPVYAEAPGVPTGVPRDSTWTARYSAEVARTIDGRTFDSFDPLTYFVRLEAVTEDPGETFGNADIGEVALRIRQNTPATVTVDSVDVTSSNPVVAWTYADTEEDPQTHFDVRVLLPATIAADPTAALEDLDAEFETGITSGANRAYQIDGRLEPSTLYTFAVRASQRVAGRRLDSEWSTINATTAAATGTTPAVAAVAGVGEVTVTVSGIGAASLVDLYRDGEPVIAGLTPTTERTVDSVDSFDRADGALGSEEGANSRAWTVDTGTSGTSTVLIDGNAAQIAGDGAATVPVGQADLSVSALVDVTLAPAGVRLRSGGTGEVEAIVGADLVELRTFDGSGVAHPANTVAIAHSIGGETIGIQLVASGDDYFVFLNGELHIRNTDATVPSAAETGAGITSGGYTGTHRVDLFEARLLDSTVVYQDVPPAGAAIVYGATASTVDVGSDVHTSALGVASPVTVTVGSWRLRSLFSSASLAFSPEDLDVDQGRPGRTTQLLTGGVDVNYTQPRPRRFRMSIRTLNKADFDTLEVLLSLTGDLGLSDVFGNSYTVRHASDVSWEQVVSEPEPGEAYPVRHHWVATVTFQEVTT